MAKVFISLGSNIGNRLKNLREGVERIGKIEGVEIVRKSSIYETEPMGNVNQDPFLNMVIEIETEIHPFELMDMLLKIEDEMGRKREVRWGPRNIDIDMLLYNGVVIESEILTVPHPRMEERNFIITPLKEIMGDDFYKIIEEHGLNIDNAKGWVNIYKEDMEEDE